MKSSFLEREIKNPYSKYIRFDRKNFINREKEVEFFREQIKLLKEGKHKHIVLTGSKGIGKTFLKEKFKDIAGSSGYAVFEIVPLSINGTCDIVEIFEKINYQVQSPFKKIVSKPLSYIKEASLGMGMLDITL